jgi:hypothetical protein
MPAILEHPLSKVGAVALVALESGAAAVALAFCAAVALDFAAAAALAAAAFFPAAAFFAAAALDAVDVSAVNLALSPALGALAAAAALIVKDSEVARTVSMSSPTTSWSS